LLALLPAELLQHSHDEVALNACVGRRRHIIIIRPRYGASSPNTTTCALHWDLHHTLLRLLLVQMLLLRRGKTATNSVCCTPIVRYVRAGLAPHHEMRGVL
jgi:hypothetical protein